MLVGVTGLGAFVPRGSPSFTSILPRGSQVLRAVLGETFGGVIGCDCFSAYHKYMADGGATVQFCVPHLIRDIRFLAEQTNKSIARWGEKLLE
jgi:hypothetical protein